MILPNDTQRHLVVGCTGSGKTTLGIYMLALRDYLHMPWIICNFKDDELINAIPATELDGLTLPKKLRPGLYIARPTVDEFEGMENLMLNMWHRRDNGLFIDEELAISTPKHPAFRRILTQGRSRHVPVIGLTQRPVDIDRYSFSESEFFSVMKLYDERETDRIKEIIGDELGNKLDLTILPKYHSYYIDRINNTVTIARPVPEFDQIIDTFTRRIKRSSLSHLI